MKTEDFMLHELSQYEWTNTVLLSELSRRLRFIETKEQWWLPEAGGEGRVGSYYLIHSISDWDDEKFWRCILVMVVQQCEYSFFVCEYS